MKKLNLKLSVSLLILYCLFLTGCNIGGAGAFIKGDSPEKNNLQYTGENTSGDMLVLNLLSEPENLNPYISTSASATNIYKGYIYESFIDTQREPPWGDLPLLVESLPEISEDHLRYRWKLRENIKWHDGNSMTMHDAVFSLKAIMNPYVDDLPTKTYYRELDSLKLTGDYNLEMYCSQPYFMHQDFLGGFQVLPKHVFDEKGLMDDLTYYQVVYGSSYGNIADFLESEKEANWGELVASITVDKLSKSITSITENGLKWSDVTESLQGLEVQKAEVQFDRVLNFLTEHEDAKNSARWMTETSSSLKKALSALPIITEISKSATPGSFPLREELTERCRDIHDRIEEFGIAFNKHPNNRAPTVGSGVFVFDRWITGQEIVLRRNDNYWRGDGYSHLDKIVWRVLTDYTASLVALKNGEIDFMENLTTIQYLTMTNRKSFLESFIKDTYVVPSYNYLGWRAGHPIFADKRVRRAMTHMVRRKDVAEKLLFGFAEIVTAPFYRYGMDYDSTITPYEYDPELSLQILTDAGWADVDNNGILEKDTLEFKFELLIPSGSPFAAQLASILREDLFMIGVEMEIRQLEWSVFINNYIRNHTFDACYLGWVFGMKGDPKQVWHSESATGRGSNHVEFKNAEADSLIDAARVEFDQEKRVAMYRRFQQILHEEQPYTFMFSNMRKPAFDRRFKGVKWYPFRPGYQLDEWFVPSDEQKYMD